MIGGIIAILLGIGCVAVEYNDLVPLEIRDVRFNLPIGLVLIILGFVLIGLGL